MKTIEEIEQETEETINDDKVIHLYTTIGFPQALCGYDLTSTRFHSSCSWAGQFWPVNSRFCPGCGAPVCSFCLLLQS